MLSRCEGRLLVADLVGDAALERALTASILDSLDACDAVAVATGGTHLERAAARGGDTSSVC